MKNGEMVGAALVGGWIGIMIGTFYGGWLESKQALPMEEVLRGASTYDLCHALARHHPESWELLRRFSKGDADISDYENLAVEHVRECLRTYVDDEAARAYVSPLHLPD